MFFDPSTKTWYGKDMRRGVMFVIYEGDVSVERIHDADLGMTFTVVRSDDVVVYGDNDKKVIEEFLDKEPKAVNTVMIRPFLKMLIGNTEVRKGHIVSGFYQEGFVEGLVPYPAVSWECQPAGLEEIAKYITITYPPTNRAFALANVAFATAKVFAPAVRLSGRYFEDKVILNIGDAWSGVSNIFESTINLLGLTHDWTVWTMGDYFIGTPSKAKATLTWTNAPLFLDSVRLKGLRVLAGVLPTMLAGTEAPRSLRSIMTSTTLSLKLIERTLAKWSTDWMNYFAILKWRRDHISSRVRPYMGKTILGCLRELWEDQGFRNRVLNEALSDADLVEMTMEEMHRRYGIDTSPYVEALKLVAGAEGSAEVAERP